MFHRIKDSANNIITLTYKYEKEPLKSRKLQILNEILKEISSIEKDCLPNLKGSMVTGKEKKELMKELNINKKTLTSIEEKELENIYKGNVYGKISNFFFNPVSLQYKKRFPSSTEKLRSNLLSSGMNILSISYISISLFTSFLLFFIGSAIGVITFYIYSYWCGFLLGLILSILSLLIFYNYPSYLIKKRKRELESEYPFIVNFLASISNSNVTTLGLFQTLLNSKHYKAINVDIKRILNFVMVFNYNLPEALKKVAINNPSPRMRELFYELSQEIEEKKDLKKYLNAKAKLELSKYKITKTSFIDRSKNLYNETIKLLHFKILYAISILIGTTIITLSIFYYQELNLIVLFLIILANIIAWLPIITDLYKIWNKNKELELQFFYFARDLGKTKNLLNLKKNYKSLDQHIKKLANQFKIGIPIETALLTFSKEVNNQLIESTIITALEAKKHGASIYEALDQIATSKIIRNTLRTENTN